MGTPGRTSSPSFGPTGDLAAAEIERVGNILRRDEDARAREANRAHTFERPAKEADYAIINETEISCGKTVRTPHTMLRWRALPEAHPLVVAWRRGKLDPAQFNAGNLYRVLYECAHDPRGRDSTQTLNVSCSFHGASGATAADILAARKAIARVESRLSRVDRIIVECFCGRGLKAAQAVNAAVVRDPRAIWDRLTEAIDELARVTANEPRPDGAPMLGRQS